MKRRILEVSILVVITFATSLSAKSQGDLGLGEIERCFADRSVQRQSLITLTKIGNPIGHNDLVDTGSRLFALPYSCKLVPVDTIRENSARSHVKFVQYVGSVPVEGGAIVAHLDNDTVTSISGNVVRSISQTIGHRLTSKQALEIALRNLPSNKYAWEDLGEETLLKMRKKRDDVSHYPEPTLIYKNVGGEKHVLCYKVLVYSLAPYFMREVVIDANNGIVYNAKSVLKRCTAATANLVYNGPQSIETLPVPALNLHTLFDDCRGDGVYTFKWEDDEQIEVTNVTTTWGSNNKEFTQAHWAGMQYYDFLYDEFNRDGIDDNDVMMVQQVYTVSGGAHYGAGRIVLFGSGFHSPGWQVSLDLVGHEWTHGLIKNTMADLSDLSSTESGGIVEGICDIFGDQLECYSGSAECGKYKHGEEYMTDTIPDWVRDLKNPKTKGKAEVYCGENWSDGDNYIKSGVLSKWYYLLAESGTFVNDHCCDPDTFTVPKIDGDKVVQILYYVLINGYVVGDVDYADMRAATITAADNLYTSTEVAAVKVAWDAVGVYDDHYKHITGTYTSATAPDTEVAHYKIETCILPESTSPNLVINDGGELTLKAGHYVRFSCDVHAKSGSFMHAKIELPCEDFNFAKHGQAGIKNGTEERGRVSSGASESLAIEVYPNPARDQISVTISSSYVQKVDIVLVDMTGRVVSRLSSGLAILNGSNRVSFSIDTFSAGAYLIIVKGVGSQAVRIVSIK